VPVYVQLVLHGLEWMPLAQHVLQAIGAQHQEARWLPTPGEHGQYIQRGVVAPVQVFEYEHQRLHGCQSFEGLGQLAQHALACGAEPCMFYVRYARPLDLHLHPMPQPKK
jgi:hypothetical protein